MTKKKKLIIWGGVAIIAVTIISFVLSGIAVETTEIRPQTAELSFTETGVVKSQSSIDVFGLVPGEIVSIRVQEGYEVRRGDILLVVDSTELQNQIRQIQAHDNRPNIAAQEVVVNQRRSELAQAEQNHQRMAALYQANAIALIEYQNSVAAVTAANSVYEGAIAQLAVIRAGTAGVDSQIATLRNKIENATIRSPIDGVVSTLHVQGTNIVSAGLPVARITALDTPSEIELFVATRDVNHINVGERVNITFEDRVQNINAHGVIEHIDSRAQPIISALGVAEQRVRVVVSFDHVSLREGFEVDVTFILHQEENRLIVPRTAVFEYDGRYHVFVVRGGRAQAVAVTKGMGLRRDYVITSGIAEGDIVINDANQSGLRDGARVRVR